MLIRPNWPPVMNAVNGLIDCTTSPDSGSLKVGMGGSFLVSVQDTRRGSPAGRLYLWWCDLGRIVFTAPAPCPSQDISKMAQKAALIAWTALCSRWQSCQGS